MVFPIFSLLSLISSPQILSYACSTYSNTIHLCRCLSPFSTFSRPSPTQPFLPSRTSLSALRRAITV
jgi:hypothetical protein